MLSLLTDNISFDVNLKTCPKMGTEPFNFFIALLAISTLSQSFRIYPGSGGSMATPKIKLTGWIEGDNVWEIKTTVSTGDDYAPVSTLDSGSTYIITSDVAFVAFVCEAPYPIEWGFSQSKWYLAHEGGYIRSAVINRRISGMDLNDTKSFSYWSQLSMTGDALPFNGVYSCGKVRTPEVQTTFKLFWRGFRQKTFVLSERNLTVWIDSENKITFPCYVTHPSADVSLLQQVFNGTGENRTESWTKLELTSALTYDPSAGFTFQKMNRQASWMDAGVYKCITADETDFVTINLITSEPEPDAQLYVPNAIRYNATFYRNDSSTGTGLIKCCSSSASHPLLRRYRSDGQFGSQRIEEAMKNEIHNTISRLALFSAIMYYEDSCSVLKESPYYLMQSELSYIRCMGDGVNYLEKTFSPNPLKLDFTNWDTKNLENWAYLTAKFQKKDLPQINNTIEIYSGSLVTFSCTAQAYFFSYGFRYSIELTDGTQVVNSKDGWEKVTQRQIAAIGYSTPLRGTNVQNITSDMASVSCWVPVWNSSDWVKKSLKLLVKQSILPALEGSDDGVPEIFWNLNDTQKSLTCKASGAPEPHLIWFKDDNPLSGSLFNVTKHEDGSHTLKIPVVTHDIQGEFKCVAINPVGQVKKTFRVYVEESEVLEVTVAICATVVILILAVGIIILIRKTVLQKQILSSSTEDT